MKTLKVIVCALAIFGVFSLYAKRVAPEKEGAVVVAGDGAEDRVVVVNKSENDASLKVYGYNKKTQGWDFVCKAEDVAPNKKSKVKTPFDGDLDDFKFFAIETVGDGAFNYTAKEEDDDLYIYVYDE